MARWSILVQYIAAISYECLISVMLRDLRGMYVHVR